MSDYRTELVTPTTIPIMVSAYTEAIIAIDDHYRRLAEVEVELRDAFLGSGKYPIHMELAIGRYWKADDPKEYCEARKDYIRRAAWRYIVDHIGARRFLSQKRLDDLTLTIEDGVLPEFTEANILQTLLELRTGLPDMVDEVCKEAFKLLTPGRYSDNKLKTNSGFKIGSKVILDGWVYSWGAGSGAAFHPQHNRYDDMRSIDKAFRLLDGKGVGAEDGRSELADTIYANAAAEGETEYFKYKCFGNGNLHLTFKRMDLVVRINQIAGGGSRLGDGR